MKRIGIFLNYSSSGGGIYQYAISILDALYLTDYEIIILCNQKFWNKDLLKYKNKFKIYPLKNPKYFDFLSKFLLLIKAPHFIIRFIYEFLNSDYKLKKFLKCDLWIYPYPDLASYQSGLNYIVAIHDLMHIYEPNYSELSGFLKTAIRNERFRRVSKSSKGILVDSNLGKLHLEESYNVKSKKIYILPFVPPKYIQEFNKKSVLVFENLKLPKKYFFYPAKFWSHKNHIRLLKAIFIIKKKHEDIHFVFTGSKKHDYQIIKNGIKKLSLENQITILGEINSDYIPQIYSNCQALFMPTIGGPTNIPPLEAILCECPMAVSNIYAMPEQLKNASLYFDPNSEKNMAEVMEELWTNKLKCEFLVQEGKKLKKFISIESHKERLIKIINEN